MALSNASRVTHTVTTTTNTTTTTVTSATAASTNALSESAVNTERISTHSALNVGPSDSPSLASQKAPVMRSRSGGRHALTRSHASAEEQNLIAAPENASDVKRTQASMQLDALARNFEKFFWRPSVGTQANLLIALGEINSDRQPFDGLDASALVMRIFRCHGLLDPERNEKMRSHNPLALSGDDIRATVSEVLECLAKSGATLFNTDASRSLGYLLTCAVKNKLIPELTTLIRADLDASGEHRVLQTIWDYGEKIGLSISTLVSLFRISDHLNYPVPDDTSVGTTCQIIGYLKECQPPLYDDQAWIGAQLCAAAWPSTSVEEFEELLNLVTRLGFEFDEVSLSNVVGKLILNWDKDRDDEDYGEKLSTVLSLTGLHPDDIEINKETALIRAARTGNAPLLALMLDYGANPTRCGRGRQRPVDYLLEKREVLMSDIDEMTSKEQQIFTSQDPAISKSLMEQLKQNEWMISALEKAERAFQ